jgi:hypothetical protein
MNLPTTQSVMDSLVRVAPDEYDGRGLRVVRHVGPGVRVVSRVDTHGRLLRQELVLGREVVVWQHGTRVRTGLLPKEDAEAAAGKFDQDPSRLRLERARMVVTQYAGRDKYVRHLARAVQLSAGFGGADQVTDDPAKRRRNRKAWAAQGPTVPITVLAIATFLVVFMVLRFTQ